MTVAILALASVLVVMTVVSIVLLVKRPRLGDVIHGDDDQFDRLQARYVLALTLMAPVIVGAVGLFAVDRAGSDFAWVGLVLLLVALAVLACGVRIGLPGLVGVWMRTMRDRD